MAEVEEERESDSVEQPEVDGEWVPLVVWLARLAVTAGLAVPKREGHRADEDADRIEHTEGVRETV